jgi:hypothetical protein
MSRAGDIQNELKAEWAQLQATWQDSQVAWKDAVAGQFAGRFMSSWETEMPLFLSALEQLEEELEAGRRELV